MTHRALDRLLAVLVALALVGLAAGSVKMARAHDPYLSWTIPGTVVSCCNKNDCRPTHARMDDNEQWEAWDGHRWLKVPPDRVLKFPSPDGRSHLCEMNGNVFCFVPGEVRS